MHRDGKSACFVKTIMPNDISNLNAGCFIPIFGETDMD